MGITVEDVQQGIRRDNIHGQAWGFGNVPYWEGQFLSELALLVAGEEIVYAQAIWQGDRQEARAEVVVFTESLVVTCTVPDSRGAGHTTGAFARTSLLRLEVSAEGDFDDGDGPGRVELTLSFESADPICIPGSGDAKYMSTKLVRDLVPGFRNDLKAQ